MKSTKNILVTAICILVNLVFGNWILVAVLFNKNSNPEKIPYYLMFVVPVISLIIWMFIKGFVKIKYNFFLCVFFGWLMSLACMFTAAYIAMLFQGFGAINSLLDIFNLVGITFLLLFVGFFITIPGVILFTIFNTICLMFLDSESR